MTRCAWYSQVVGELNVEWNEAGVVQGCEGVPHLLLDEPITREQGDDDVELTGADRDAELAAIEADAQLSLTAPDATVEAALQSYTDQLEEFANEVIGTATEDLCLARIPGEAYGDSTCNGEDPNRGSDIDNVVAQAFLYMSMDADVYIQNGGGVRTDIFAGDITIGDAYTLLPFGNTLTNLDMTGAEIRAVLNEAVEYAHSDSTGAYPYAAGLRWYVDMSRAAGDRLYDIEYRVRNEGAWMPLEDRTQLKVVSNSFTAEGRDGYVTFGEVSEDGRAEDTFLDYAQSFVDYMMEVGTISKPATDEYSTQNYTPVP